MCVVATVLVRILNKLTPETFPRLSHQLIHDVGITSQQTLKGAVILVSGVHACVHMRGECVYPCACMCVLACISVCVYVCAYVNVHVVYCT